MPSARPGFTIAAVLALGSGILSLLWVCSEGSRSLWYLPIYLGALLPGLPIGFALFGRRHAAGWLSGGLLGYALSGVAWSIAVSLGARGWPGLLIAWAALLAVTVGTRALVGERLIALPTWSRRDTTALLLVLLLVPALMWLPYARNGAPDDTGARSYRAYFTADFVWHMALTGQMTRLSWPPRNPFFADQTMHYNWTYFIVPAVGASVLGAGVSGGHVVEQCLEINAILSGLLFIGALFLATWAAVPKAAPAAAAVTLAVVAASVQGWYGIYLFGHGHVFNDLRGQNIGALTNWILHGLRIDALPRALWWTPHHAMACALGLVAVIAVSAAPVATPVAAILITGVALGGALTISTMVGGAFALVYGGAVTIAAARSRGRFLSTLSRHSLAAAPVAASLGWVAFYKMFGEIGSSLAFGSCPGGMGLVTGVQAGCAVHLGGLAQYAPYETLLLALGPLLVPAVIGLALSRLSTSVVPHILGVLVGILLLYFVRLATDEAWVGFRAGHILQITLPGLMAVWFARLFDSHRAVRLAGMAVVALVLVSGLPTTLIDVHNAADTANRALSPGGFKWTIGITPAEQAAFDWIRQGTPRDAVVQMETTSRGRETWTLVPSFAERRMAAGDYPLQEDPAHRQLNQRVKVMYETTNPNEAWDIARQLRIDYVYADRVERQHFAAGLAKFAASPHFQRVYTNDEVLIYAVRR